MKTTPSLQCDFYKIGHKNQYPTGTEFVYSNLTPRKSRLPGINEIVFFGLQYFVREFLIKQWNESFFNKPEEEVMEKYMRRINTSLGQDAITYDHIRALYRLKYLPIEIKALPEGSLVPMRVPCCVIYNTLPEFFWLTNYFETILSCEIWQPCTAATIAYNYKKILNEYADKTVGDRSFVQWQGHDFSFRGMSSIETACKSGAAHLLSFTGTDTIPAIEFLEKYYEADCTKELIGASVPATEHSVMCMGSKESEIETFERLINKVYPKGIVSIVSDTWDFWKVITEYLPVLKQDILSRDGKCVIRPDSGDPVRIICGYDKDEYFEENGTYYHFDTDGTRIVLTLPEIKGAIQCMWEVFGGTETKKGYKLLDSHIGLIYGDSITLERCEAICSRLEKKGFCSFNVVLGIGSYTYQYVTRDTFGFAVKATYGKINGEAREIFKEPKTDDGTKNSAKGLVAVYRNENNGSYYLKDQVSWEESENNALETVFKDGKLVKYQSLSNIRNKLSN